MSVSLGCTWDLRLREGEKVVVLEGEGTRDALSEELGQLWIGS